MLVSYVALDSIKCLEWEINLTYSTLFTYIPLLKFNQWDSLVPPGWRKKGLCHMNIHGLLYYCKKTSLFPNGMVETMVSNVV